MSNDNFKKVPTIIEQNSDGGSLGQTGSNKQLNTNVGAYGKTSSINPRGSKMYGGNKMNFGAGLQGNLFQNKDDLYSPDRYDDNDKDDKGRSFFDREVVDFDTDNNKECECYKNAIKTSKYTWYNFLPLNLMYQFKKTANMYFIFICIGQCIKPISITNGHPMNLPALMFVVVISMIKDAYEDHKRHLNDEKENNDETQRLVRGGGNIPLKLSWQQIKVGHVIIVEEETIVPADMVLLQTSNNDGSCFVETKSLDGETNLKMKVTQKQLLDHFPKEERRSLEAQTSNEKQSKKTEPLGDFRAQILCEEPNNDIYKFNGTVQIEDENYLELTEKIPLSYDNIVLRGMQIKNTKEIIGMVIYAGHDTKVMQNQSKPIYKFSKLEKKMHQTVKIVLILQCILAVLAAFVGVYQKNTENSTWALYIEIEEHYIFKGLFAFINMLGTWILIMTNLVPISLIVSLEMVKYFQCQYMESDYTMYDRTTGWMQAQTSNLNEELGYVEYVFSDKTGTLTCNNMQFTKFCAGVTVYGDEKQVLEDEENADKEEKEKASRLKATQALQIQPHVNFNDPKLFETLEIEHPNHNELMRTLVHMALSHTVIMDQRKKEYSGSSPDELALVNAAKYCGASYERVDKQGNVILKIRSSKDAEQAQEFKFKQLDVCEFNSQRKRMSVIYKDPDNKIVLRCKGADSIIQERLTQESKHSAVYKQNKRYVNKFAKEGLRTLFLAERILTQKEYDDWKKKRKIAMTRIQDRDEEVEKIDDEIEQKLELIGTTAIEDKLQKNVKDTIEFMKQADIKVWVLTGDKVGTAKMVGISTGLLEPDMEENKTLYHIIDNREEKILQEQSQKEGGTAINEENDEDSSQEGEQGSHSKTDGVTISSYEYGTSHDSQERDYEYYELKLLDIKEQCKAVSDENLKLHNNEKKTQGIVVDGCSLLEIFDDDQLKDIFLGACDLVDVVLACRVSPSQKADIVEEIQKRFPEKTTLAIGDGANDVSMIMKANVGVGISGREGLQAARSADYAIGQFQFLKTLLFVHGREAYRRNSLLILYNFFKNTVYVTTQYFFGFRSAFSGQVLYDPFLYQLFNITCTTFPILWYALYDYEYEKRPTDRSMMFEIEHSDYSKEKDLSNLKEQGTTSPWKFFMLNPHLYKIGIRNECFTEKIFVGYILYGLLYAFSIYKIVYYVLCQPTFALSSGKQVGLWVAGDSTYGVCVLVVNFMLLHRFNKIDKMSYFLLILSCYSYYFALSMQSQMVIFPRVFGTFDNTWHQPLIWLTVACVFLQTSAIEKLHFIVVNKKMIFNNYIKREYQELTEAHKERQNTIIQKHEEALKKQEEALQLAEVEELEQAEKDHLQDTFLNTIDITESQRSQSSQIKDQSQSEIANKVKKSKTRMTKSKTPQSVLFLGDLVERNRYKLIQQIDLLDGGEEQVQKFNAAFKKDVKKIKTTKEFNDAKEHLDRTWNEYVTVQQQIFEDSAICWEDDKDEKEQQKYVRYKDTKKANEQFIVEDVFIKNLTTIKECLKKCETQTQNFELKIYYYIVLIEYNIWVSQFAPSEYFENTKVQAEMELSHMYTIFKGDELTRFNAMRLGLALSRCRLEIIMFRDIQKSRAILDEAIQETESQNRAGNRLERSARPIYEYIQRIQNVPVAQILTDQLWEDYRETKDEKDFTFVNCIYQGYKNLENSTSVGAYAGSMNSYYKWNRLFDPLIRMVHNHDPTKDKHQTNMNASELQSSEFSEEEAKMISYIRLEVSRNLQLEPIGPKVFKVQREKIFQKIKLAIEKAFKDHNELAGTYLPIESMSNKEKEIYQAFPFYKLEREKFIQSCTFNGSQLDNRYTYHNEERNLSVWINEEDHLRIVSIEEEKMSMKNAFERLCKVAKLLENELRIAKCDHRGYITTNPLNLGTTLRATVYVKIPNLVNNRNRFGEIVQEHILDVQEIPESRHGIYAIMNGQRLGKSERDIIQGLIDGVKDIISAEEYEQANPLEQSVLRQSTRQQSEVERQQSEVEAHF